MRRVEGDHAWALLLETMPAAHLLQSSSWGEFKSHYGWTPERWAWDDSDGKPIAAAQVLRRWWPARGRWVSILYCPRGPAMDWADESLARAVLRDLANLASARRTVMIKIEPDVAASDQAEKLLQEAGWARSSQPVQFGSTMVLKLGRNDDDLLAAMKPKTRYNIRLAEKRGVVVRLGAPGEDFDRLVALYAETAVRDGFVIRPRDYYLRAWGGFIAAGLAQPFLAEVEGQAVAGLVVFRFGRRAWYLYGMSGSAHREAMPNHALQWAAIRWARDAGCESYDFWGAPEAADPADPLWGLYRFKEGFGARHVRLIGSWDHTDRPLLYWLYSIALPRVLSWTRRRQEERTKQTVDPAP
jgi:lipid II:glycine glycyltransferase (peptidoglycan interpeptide bridge formation enzyme)